MARSNVLWLHVLVGTGLDNPDDTNADKRAVRKGYLYDADIKKYHHSQFFFPKLNPYQMSIPSFDFKAKYNLKFRK